MDVDWWSSLSYTSSTRKGLRKKIFILFFFSFFQSWQHIIQSLWDSRSFYPDSVVMNVFSCFLLFSGFYCVLPSVSSWYIGAYVPVVMTNTSSSSFLIHTVTTQSISALIKTLEKFCWRINLLCIFDKWCFERVSAPEALNKWSNPFFLLALDLLVKAEDQLFFFIILTSLAVDDFVKVSVAEKLFVLEPQ